MPVPLHEQPLSYFSFPNRLKEAEGLLAFDHLVSMVAVQHEWLLRRASAAEEIEIEGVTYEFPQRMREFAQAKPPAWIAPVAPGQIYLCPLTEQMVVPCHWFRKARQAKVLEFSEKTGVIEELREAPADLPWAFEFRANGKCLKQGAAKFDSGELSAEFVIPRDKVEAGQRLSLCFHVEYQGQVTVLEILEGILTLE